MSNTQKQALIVVALVIVVALAAYLVPQLTATTTYPPTAQYTPSTGQTDTATLPTQSEVIATTAPRTTTSDTATVTKHATVSYQVPRGTDMITVEIQLQSGMVKEVAVTAETSSRDSERFVSSFQSQYKSYVVGKKLSDISLSRVGGASLTTSAFMDAINQISSS